MKILNPTKERIYAVSRVNGWWWDGIGPGETFETDDERSLRALIKHGCVEVAEETVKKESKKKVVKDAVRKKELKEKKIVKKK